MKKWLRIVFTKKRAMLLVIALSFISFLALLKLIPFHIVESNELFAAFFYAKLAFMSVCLALAISLIIVVWFRRKHISELISTFLKYRYYLFLLVKRDFVTKYKRSVLGVLWSFLNPMLTMLIMMLVFKYIFARDIPNYSVYLLSGFIIFNLFAESTNTSLTSVTSSTGIIGKIYVPKYIFPLSKTISALINVPFSLIAFVIVFIASRQPLYETALLFPIPFIYAFLFSVGVSLALSAASVFFRDVTYLWGVFLTLLNYLTPIFYPVSIMPEWIRELLAVNPMYHFIDYFRNLTMYGIIPGLWENLVCICFVLISISAGLYVFMSRQNDFVLYV